MSRILSAVGSLDDIPAIFEGKADDMHLALEAVEDYLKDRDVDRESCAELLAATDELYSNICIHSGAKEAQILCEVTDSRIRMVFVDDGVPYNPLEHAEPDVTLTAEEREIGGLGIYMVRRMMDEVHYEYVGGRNCLTIAKGRA